MTYPKVFLAATFILSCGPTKSDYDRVVMQNDSLKTALDDIKFGPDRLLKEANHFFKKNELDRAKEALDSLVLRHPSSNEAIDGKRLLLAVEKEIAKEAERAKLEHKQRQELELRKIAEATSSMRKRHDEFKKLTWYKDQSSPQYNNQNGLYLYFSVQDGSQKAENLRLRIQYYADSWLFIESYTFSLDGRIFEFTPRNVEHDNDSDIWEWSDDAVNDKLYIITRTISNAREAKIRFNGKQYYKDKIISEAQKKALRNVFTAYQALGGSTEF